MKIGYARVSTPDQSLDLQTDALLAAGVSPDFMYSEHKSGAYAKRPALDDCMKILRKGDTLVVWKLDRLGRSLKDLIQLSETFQERGVELISLQDCIDTNTPTGKFMFHMMGAIAEFERAMIVERTKAGLAASRKRGKKGGRKPKLSDAKVMQGQDLLKMKGWDVSAVARSFKVSRQTWYRAVERLERKMYKKKLKCSANVKSGQTEQIESAGVS
jgi:DNA invertase Pin-like site-specific DNA recombinase